VIAVSHATCADQREVVSTLEGIAAAVADSNLESPVMTIVGEVVNLRVQACIAPEVPS
jgi:siroheme synthase